MKDCFELAKVSYGLPVQDLSSVRRYRMRNTLLGGSFFAGSVIKIDMERVCFAELIFNT